ncbi:SDR family oxidoreductase (plasmid) [Sphingobium sp. JS3065]|uniref:SDR family NAD(P)-dependent oxidoreductase n=1 Tax=Sphingobium sp. JS3065 TaxID=2970925 RepID=UPI002264C756|nr:SDR family oxidoreductase [Sphingobium sp. JS3065]UZW58298.1 SDR family oxidoreductase [Sphingobium sp. JS3065]
MSKEVCVVTGGASGIGLGAAMAMARSGATVAILDKRAEACASALEEMKRASLTAHSYVVDVTDPVAVNAAAESIEAELGPVTGLVTSAGISIPGAPEHMPLEDWQAVMDVGVTGIFICCQAFGRYMLERKRGAIVIVSSIAGFGCAPNRPNYTASKWAAMGLTKSLAVCWADRNVRVNCLAPGFVDTPLARASTGGWQDILMSRNPMGRSASPDEIGNVVQFMLSDASSYMTGNIMAVDGGQTSSHFHSREPVPS